jgi:phenylalanyl-tRNA synthetase beta chain
MDVSTSTILDSLATLEIMPTGDWDLSRDEGLFVPPSYRKDIEIEEDLIEEVARVVGYDAIPTRLSGIAGPSDAPGLTR